MRGPNGGYCAYAVSKGKLVTVDPDVYVVLDEKLFLFSNAEARAAFENEEPGIVPVADGKWAELESERRASLHPEVGRIVGGSYRDDGHVDYMAQHEEARNLMSACSAARMRCLPAV